MSRTNDVVMTDANGAKTETRFRPIDSDDSGEYRDNNEKNNAPSTLGQDHHPQEHVQSYQQHVQQQHESNNYDPTSFTANTDYDPEAYQQPAAGYQPTYAIGRVTYGQQPDDDYVPSRGHWELTTDLDERVLNVLRDKPDGIGIEQLAYITSSVVSDLREQVYRRPALYYTYDDWVKARSRADITHEWCRDVMDYLYDRTSRSSRFLELDAVLHATRAPRDADHDGFIRDSLSERVFLSKRRMGKSRRRVQCIALARDISRVYM